MTRAAILAAVVALSAPTTAVGQVLPDERFFVNLNVIHHDSVSWWIESTFPSDQKLYEISHDLHGGAARDVSAGIRLVSNLSAGVAISRWSTTSDLSVSTYSHIDYSHTFLGIAQRRLDHRQVAYHFPLAWTVPVADRVDLAILGGPSLFRVTHNAVTGVEIEDTSDYPDVLVLTRPTREAGSGYHYGFDFSVRWNEWLGFGLLMRATHGSLPSPGWARPTTEWYASELCLGLRLRF